MQNILESTLSNPLATPDQLLSSASRLDGVPKELETSAIFLGARLTQCAGILLRLSQETIAQAIVVYTRFWVGPKGGSLRRYAVKDVAAASLYLVAKLSSYPKLPRSIINVFAYLESLGSVFLHVDDLEKNNPDDYYVSESTYYERRTQLIATEAKILFTLGFQTQVSLPHVQCINYLQTMGVFDDDKAQEVARRAHAHLNSALFSPQLLYITHQPSSLATAAIYLAAREIGLKLAGVDWWEVFDVDREELGFLVVALNSMDGFVKLEKETWKNKKSPLTIDILEQEIQAL
jgi:hypothetical protein